MSSYDVVQEECVSLIVCIENLEGWRWRRDFSGRITTFLKRSVGLCGDI